MASQPVPDPKQKGMVIPVELREALHLQETATHFAVQTFPGATLLRPKAEIKYPWELLQGILDDGKDTREEKHRECDWEFAHDERKFGATDR